MKNRRLLVMLAFLVGMAAFPAFGADSPKPAELRLPDLQGRTRDLGEFKGKVVLVNFWAAWCKPCRDEMPMLEDLRQKYGEKGLEIVAVNLAESAPRIQSFLKAFMPDGVSFVIVQDRNSQAYKQWAVRALPSSYLLDREGLVRWQGAGELDPTDEATMKRIEALLN